MTYTLRSRSWASEFHKLGILLFLSFFFIIDYFLRIKILLCANRTRRERSNANIVQPCTKIIYVQRLLLACEASGDIGRVSGTMVEIFQVGYTFLSRVRELGSFAKLKYCSIISRRLFSLPNENIVSRKLNASEKFWSKYCPFLGRFHNGGNFRESWGDNFLDRNFCNDIGAVFDNVKGSTRVDTLKPSSHEWKHNEGVVQFLVACLSRNLKRIRSVIIYNRIRGNTVVRKLWLRVQWDAQSLSRVHNRSDLTEELCNRLGASSCVANCYCITEYEFDEAPWCENCS